MWRIAVAASVGFILTTAPSADANGRFPRAEQVVFQPLEPDSIAIITTFGVVVSDDRGASFRFICEEAFQYLDGEDPSITIGSDGTLMVGVADGLVAMGADRCRTTRRADLENQRVIDLAASSTGATVVAALASPDADSVARVARSDDGGHTFTVPSVGFPGLRLETVEIAPSDSMRIYASGYDSTTRQDTLLRSDDGGTSFRRVSPAVMGTSGWFVSGVDPMNADVFYVRARLANVASTPDAGDSTGTVLFRSDDGGDHLREVARTSDDMTGFAIDDTGRSVWMGSRAEGLWRSDDGAPFVHVTDVSLECLRFDRGALYVCETFSAGGVLLGRSRDRGATIESVLRFSQIGAPPHCRAGTIAADICPGRWSQVRSTIGATMGAMDASVDAGHGSVGANCACGVRAHTRATWMGIAVIALLLARPRRRRPID